MKKQPFNYLHFLFGMIAFEMFALAWSAILPDIFLLKCVIPGLWIPIVSNLLMLTIFFWIFRRHFFTEVKWGHFVGFILLISTIAVFSEYLAKAVLANHTYFSGDLQRDNRAANVQFWLGVACNVLLILFVWWKYYMAERGANKDTETVGKERSFYIGVMLMLMMGRLMSILSSTGRALRMVTHQEMLVEILFGLGIVTLTLVIFMLVYRKVPVRFPLLAIVMIVGLACCCTYLTPPILLKNFPQAYHHPAATSYLDTTTSICRYALFIAVFVLYRREVNNA